MTIIGGKIFQPDLESFLTQYLKDMGIQLVEESTSESLNSIKCE